MSKKIVKHQDLDVYKKAFEILRAHFGIATSRQRREKRVARCEASGIEPISFRALKERKESLRVFNAGMVLLALPDVYTSGYLLSAASRHKASLPPLLQRDRHRFVQSV